MTKYVYFFGKGKADGGTELKALLGGKGANLAEMTNIEIPVPPGFTISTEVCSYYSKNKEYPKGLEEEVIHALEKLERAMERKLGNPENPLLVSVRSGAPVSMPGMMDTILNLGLNDETIKGFIKQTGNERTAYDAYRRFIQMFSDIVLKIDIKKFEAILQNKKDKKGVVYDIELDKDDLKDIVKDYKRLVLSEKKDFPQEPMEQLWMAINTVFGSWQNKRAIEYRRIYKIPDTLGTAVNIQAMVFGNMGETSGTGVAFTRNPSTGEKKLYGEYLIDAQGEDVVAGIRTPKPILELKEQMKNIYKEFERTTKILEKHYKDMQDIEFTIEQGNLYFLQTRRGKRTPQAAVKIAVDMVAERLITKDEALLRVDASSLKSLLHPQIDPGANVPFDTIGLPASPGVAIGKIVFCPDEAVRLSEKEKVILVREETSPDDIHGMAVSQGILTAKGGMTSHAAVVARGMGKPCVCGCEALKIDEVTKELVIGKKRLKEGDEITIDGTSGKVYLARIPFIIPPTITDELKTLLSWADEHRRLGIRANADDPDSARKAREFGAEGIGLCRTEHMFFGEERLPIMQEMIMADTSEDRKKALDKLLSFQREDFIGIFRQMDGLPVTIRLLDPPLHEFLPNHEELRNEHIILWIQGKNQERQKEIERLIHKVGNLSEINPMLGLRGCRLGIIYPEISEMQARAILEAACILSKEEIKVFPEIMIPLVSDKAEIEAQKRLIDETAKHVFKEQRIKVDYKVGTMIEVPRACIVSDKIAEEAQFFSFGTNDLTQMTFAFSRDDAERKFLPRYLQDKLLKDNPFEVLDENGVGELIKMAIEKGRKTRKDLKVGICGEHGGDPSSVMFCDGANLDYVSCSPYRVPIARLAAGQARLKIS